MMRTIGHLLAFFVGVATGVLIGYGLGVMLAPQEGAESRALLRAQTRQLGEQQRELADKVRSRVEVAVEEGKRAAAEKRGELEAKAGVDESERPSRPLPL